MLSGKHNLLTDTHDVDFVETFNLFFELKYDTVYLKDDIVDALNDSDTYKKYFFMFNAGSIKKKRDGEVGSKNRFIDEIVVYNKETDEYYNIEDKSECTLFLSSEMNSIFKKYEIKAEDDIVLIPFESFIGEEGMPLFELEFKNNDLIEPIKKLDNIINTNNIYNYPTYEILIDTLVPLFNKAGIHMPQIHIEIIISRLTRTADMQKVDWSKKDVDYIMIPYNKAILTSDSPVISIIYQEVKQQLRGGFNFYDKKGSSIYDMIIKS